MLSRLESGIRQEQFSPALKGEGLRCILEEFVPSFQSLIDQRFTNFGYLSFGEHVELKPSLKIRPEAKIIHLHEGVYGIDRVSLDLILLWSKILRPPQFIIRNPKMSYQIDISTIHSLLAGRLGIYSGEGSRREEILHDDINGGDDIWDYTVVSGRMPYEIHTWERPALLLSIVPDTASIAPEQINLPL